MSRTKTSPIHLAGCRDELLELLRGGARLADAAEAIGCNYKAARRYIDADPDFAAKVKLAQALARVGQDPEPELPPRPAPAPVAIARVVLDAEPVDAAPCDVAEPRQPPRAMRGGPTREEFEWALAEDVLDRESKHHGKAMDICAKYFYGAELLIQLRQIERDMSKPVERPTIAAGRARVLEAITRARPAE